MAKVLVKLFGVFRMDTHIPEIEMDIARVDDLFPILNEKSLALYEDKKAEDPKLKKPQTFAFKDAIVYVNGERCPKKRKTLQEGDCVWLLSPASGG